MLILVTGVLTLSYMQFRFDQSDVKHAIETVRLTRLPSVNNSTLEELTIRHYGLPSNQIIWEAVIKSKWKGTVLVKALKPNREGNLVWEVDLSRILVIVQPSIISPTFIGL